MPLLIPITGLQPGMKLAEAIILDGRVMLRGGLTLRSEDISVLQRRFAGRQVRISDPVLDEVVEFEDDGRDRQIAADVQQKVIRSLSRAQERLRSKTALDNAEVNAIQTTVHGLIDDLRADKASAVFVTACLDPHSYVGVHAANVFYLSVLLAHRALDYVIAERRRQTKVRNLRPNFAEDLVPLGLGALVMDVALVALLPLLRSERLLTAEECTALRQHPRAGVKLLPDKMSALARMIVRTHHENCCGTGYPRGAPAERLHVFTRIVRIADAFDAATARHVYRQAMSPARVLWEMSAGPHRECYDAKLMKVFVGLIQPFPIGSRLRLSDGRHATVVRYNRQDVFDPAVVVAFDADGRPLPREKLEGPRHLRARGDLRLASFEGEDLSFLYAAPPPAERPNVSGVSTAWEAAYP
jgi:HD-GYP domain-containing protein (c-di-GMP phosphodiesterase class II)